MELKDNDILELGGLDSSRIEEVVQEKARAKSQKKQSAPPTAFELEKEARLQQREKRIAANQAYNGACCASAFDAACSAPASQPSPPDDMKEKQVLLDKIFAYKDRFKHLKSRLRKCDSATPIAELEDEVHFIEAQLSASGAGGSMTSVAFLGLMAGVEYTATNYFDGRLNLTGLSQVAKDNMSEFEPMLDELAIKYGLSGHMPVEARLGISLGMLMLTVHQANTNDPTLNESMRKMRESVDPSKAADL